jgi:hypothetical protein
MRARSVLRAVALLSTLAGLLAVPSPSFAASSSSKSKTTAKSTKKTASKSSSNKSSSNKSSSKKSSAASKPATASKPAPTSPAKAAFDPMATGTSIPAAPAATASAGAPPQRGPTRIDFDDRLIQGQTNKSGAVYLYDRKELKQRSMIKKRETFREEIVGAVYDSEL